MKPPYKVSFIITSRNEPPDLLNATIANLLATVGAHSFELIVVDDASVVPVASLHPCVQLWRNPVGLGVSPSRHKGAGYATGDVLVWLDAHMRFAPGWLEEMLAHAGSGSLLCSPFWDYDLKTCYCWGADFTWSGKRDYPNQRYPGFGLRHRVAPPEEPIVDVPAVIGACYMMNREAYGKLGGFSPLFKSWGTDEQDISARAWIKGLGVKCVTGACVGHLCRTSFPYEVTFEQLEFSQLVVVRSTFESPTIERLERDFDPIPPNVQDWLAKADVAGWRTVVQAGRVLSDQEFFALLSVPI